MNGRQIHWAGQLGLALALAVASASQHGVVAATADTPSAEPTFSRDIAPILQRS